MYLLQVNVFFRSEWFQPRFKFSNQNKNLEQRTYYFIFFSFYFFRGFLKTNTLPTPSVPNPTLPCQYSILNPLNLTLSLEQGKINLIKKIFMSQEQSFNHAELPCVLLSNLTQNQITWYCRWIWGQFYGWCWTDFAELGICLWNLGNGRPLDICM